MWAANNVTCLLWMLIGSQDREVQSDSSLHGPVAQRYSLTITAAMSSCCYHAQMGGVSIQLVISHGLSSRELQGDAAQWWKWRMNHSRAAFVLLFLSSCQYAPLDLHVLSSLRDLISSYVLANLYMCLPTCRPSAMWVECKPWIHLEAFSLAHELLEPLCPSCSCHEPFRSWGWLEPDLPHQMGASLCSS